MDELKLKIHSSLLKNMLSKKISKMIFKKLNVKINIRLNEIVIEKNNDSIHLHVDVDGDVDEKSLLKFANLIDE